MSRPVTSVEVSEAITFQRCANYNPIRSSNSAITYKVRLGKRHVGTIRHKRGEGWRYYPRGGTPGKASQDVHACMLSLESL